MSRQVAKRTAATAISALAGFAAVLGAHIARSSPRSALGQPLSRAPEAKATPKASAPATSARAPGHGTAGAGTTNPASSRPQSALGASEQYGYGVLAVRVTVEGARIIDVSVANLQTAESYSQMIAQEAIPILRQEVLQAQGVQVNGISGATYTTEAYLLSVQSALQKLRA
jgi:uncharacterized protein with FMN-binding domain